jgi:hypothetical protein
MIKSMTVKSVYALAAIGVLAAAGCTKSIGASTMSGPAPMERTSATPAATLRTTLNALLGEHVILAAAATGAAFDGRDAEFTAAASALDGNSVDIARAVGSVYGPDAEQAFLPLWRRHIGFAVDYTVGVATRDAVKQEEAVRNLIAYTEDFGAFLQSANPNLPKRVVADLVKHHVVGLKDVIDAQAGRDHARAYAAQRMATAHMKMIADPLTVAIAQQFPERFAGNPQGDAAELRTTLNVLLREHAYLAGAATSAALGGREAEFKAAAGALDANALDIASAVGSVYGADAERAFLPLWRRHIGFFVDYTVGVATNDRAKQDRAVNELMAYTEDLGAFLQSASPRLPRQVVADLVKHHVITLKTVVDAQAAKEPAKAFSGIRTAAAHMQMIADPLAETIVKQFPDRFMAELK